MESESHNDESVGRWKSQQKFLITDGAPRLEYLEYSPSTEPAGHLPPLLFLHGAWSSAAIWEASFLPWFARQGYRCYAPSLRGHRGSACDKWLRLVRVGDYLEDVERMVAEIPEPPVIVGLSMGGYLTQKYLETHRAPGAVLMAPVPVGGTGHTTRIMWRDRPLHFLLSSLFFDTRWLMRTHELVRRSCFSSSLSYEYTRKFFEDRTDESVLINLDMATTALPRPDRVQDPVLILGAENDFFFPERMIHETARAYGTEAVIFPDTAHVMPLEASWEKVAATIDQWIRQKLV